MFFLDKNRFFRVHCSTLSAFVVKDVKEAQEELDDIVASLRESAEAFSTIPYGNHFQIGLVGCRRGLLEIPAHLFLDGQVAVGSLRTYIGFRFHARPSSIRLLFGGVWLVDEKKLGEYGIEDDSQIVVVFRDSADDEKHGADSALPDGVNPDVGTVSNLSFQIVDSSGQDVGKMVERILSGEVFVCTLSSLKFLMTLQKTGRNYRGA